MKQKIYNSILILITVLFFAGAANAQFDLPNMQMPNLDLSPTMSFSLDPKTPSPNSQIAVTANLSGGSSTNNSIYTWTLNGKVQSESSGLNKSTFILKTGALGAVYNVGVTVLTPDGKNLSDSISFTTSDINLTWSSDNEAPAGYRGKILPIRNSNIIVSALPYVYFPGGRNLISQNNLIFNWTLNDKFSSEKSGAGKSDIGFRVSNMMNGDISIRLEIKTVDGSVTLIKGINIPMTTPKIYTYLADSKSNRSYGSVLKNLIVVPANLNFIAENYFFNDSKSQLKWRWFINNEEVSVSGNIPWLAGLNVPTDISRPFYIQINSSALNSNSQLETAESTFNIEVR